MSVKIDVILTKTLLPLGYRGDEVSVAAGYARNKLLPEGLAQVATDSVRAQYTELQEEIQKEKAQLLADAQDRAKAMDGKVLEVEVQASAEGKLYGALAPKEIAEIAAEAGILLDKKEVSLSETGSIREVGSYGVRVVCHPEVFANIELIVTAKQKAE